MLRLTCAGLLLVSPPALASAPSCDTGSPPCQGIEVCATFISERCQTGNGGTPPEVVKPAAHVLADAGGAAVPALIQMLENPSRCVQGTAAYTLARMGPVAVPAISALEGALMKGNSWAEAALVATHHPDAAPVLERYLRRDGGLLAVMALARLGEPGLRVLVRALAEPGASSALVSATEEAFAQLGPEGAPAAGALGRVAADEKVSSQARRSAMRSLQHIGPPAGPAAAPSLRKLLQGRRPELAREAADTLARLGDPAVVPVLLKRLRRGDASEREGAALALAQLGPKAREAVPALIRLLGGSNWSDRELAAFALGWIRDPGSIPDLVRILEVNDWRTVARAVEALGRIGSPEALPALDRVAREHWFGPVRKAAQEARAALQRGFQPEPEVGDLFHVWQEALEPGSIPDLECPAREDATYLVRRGDRTLAVPGEAPSKPPPGLREQQLPEGRKVYHEVQGGVLVGIDNGEFGGGGLLFIDTRGASHKLMHRNVQGIAETSAGLVVLAGEGHAGSTGTAYLLSRSGAARWKVNIMAELPGYVWGYTVDSEGGLVIVTQKGVVVLPDERRVQMLECGAEAGAAPSTPRAH